MERLDNSRWGFTSNCFVCEERNDAGLRIPFFHDAERHEVVAGFALDERFSGAPAYAHGGVVLAVLDEAMAWATIAIAGCFALTKETTTRFRAPVRVGARHDVRARIVDDGDPLVCEATVTDDAGQVCATARATFAPIGPAQAADAAGTEVGGEAAGFVRRH